MSTDLAPSGKGPRKIRPSRKRPFRDALFAPDIDSRTGDVANLPGGFRGALYYPPPLDQSISVECPVPGCSARVLPGMETRHKLDHTWRYLALPDLSEKDLDYLARLVDQGRTEVVAERIKYEGRRLKPPRDLDIVGQDLPCGSCGRTIRAGSPLEHVRPMGGKRSVVVHPECPTPGGVPR